MSNENDIAQSLCVRIVTITTTINQTIRAWWPIHRISNLRLISRVQILIKGGVVRCGGGDGGNAMYDGTSMEMRQQSRQPRKNNEFSCVCACVYKYINLYVVCVYNICECEFVSARKCVVLMICTAKMMYTLLYRNVIVYFNRFFHLDTHTHTYNVYITRQYIVLTIFVCV